MVSNIVPLHSRSNFELIYCTFSHLLPLCEELLVFQFLSHSRLAIPSSQFINISFIISSLFLLSHFLLLQLPQTDLDCLDPTCRRFRLENGESLAEIDEVT